MQSGDEIGEAEPGDGGAPRDDGGALRDDGGAPRDAGGALRDAGGVTADGRSRPRLRAPVMSDVGRLAGVSHQTVSRVINGSPHVRPETRDRVMAAMQELGYRPNPVARALVTGRSKMLGVVSFDTTLYGPASTLFGIERAAHEAGYFTIVASLEALDRSSVIDAVERLRAAGRGGHPGHRAACAGRRGAAARARRHAAGGGRGGTRARRSGGRGRSGGGRGERDPAPARPRPRDRLAHQRAAGLHRGHANDARAGATTLQAAAAAIPEPLEGDWSPQAGYELGRRLSRDRDVTRGVRGQRPDGAGTAARDARGRAGRARASVSVVGFDDIPEAAYFLPPLTTVRQDFIEMGRRSLRMLLRTIETGRRASAEPLVPPELIVRDSTGAAPTR